MSVRRSAFSFVTNNACTLEFVSHLGKLRRVRWIFIHYDIDGASAVKKKKKKKVRKKNYKLLLKPCMSVRLSVFSSQKSCVLKNLLIAWIFR